MVVPLNGGGEGVVTLQLSLWTFNYKANRVILLVVINGVGSNDKRGSFWFNAMFLEVFSRFIATLRSM